MPKSSLWGGGWVQHPMLCAAGPQAGDEDLSPQPCRRRQTGSWLEADSCLLRWQEGLRPPDSSRPVERGSSLQCRGRNGSRPPAIQHQVWWRRRRLGDSRPSCCKPRRRPSQVRETLHSGRSPGSRLSRLRPLDRDGCAAGRLSPGLPAGSSSSSSWSQKQGGCSVPPPAAAAHRTPRRNSVLSSGYFELISANILHRNSSFFICWVHSVMSITSFSGFRISDLKVYYWDSGSSMYCVLRSDDLLHPICILK